MMAYNQINLLLLNLTTVESMELKDDKEMELESINPYDLGCIENTCQVLGDDPVWWIVPKSINGNGIKFKVQNPFDL
jgi:hypothetical protein